MRTIRRILLSIAACAAIAATAAAGGRDEAQFTVTVMDDVSGGPETRLNVVRRSTDQVIISQPGITLDLSWFQSIRFKTEGDGADCFFLGLYGPDQGGGSLSVKRQKDGSAVIDYWFYATGNDRATEIHYHLQMMGTFDDPSNWPPAPGTTNVARASSWEMSSEGKGADRKISCTGTGAFSSGVVVTVERQ